MLNLPYSHPYNIHPTNVNEKEFVGPFYECHCFFFILSLQWTAPLTPQLRKPTATSVCGFNCLAVVLVTRQITGYESRHANNK